MAKDNTVGAPTEGLGQTVTFASGQQQGVPQAQAATRGALRMGAAGGDAQQIANGLHIGAPPEDPTFKLLMQLGAEALRPHVEAEKSAAYMQGMQRAAQGEALTEIVDEQPWYSKLFVGTSLGDGARAYTASTKATSVAVDIEENMDKLKKLGPQEFADYANQKVQSSLTGDTITDVMFQQQVAHTMPTTMKGQSKAHFRYQQQTYETGLGDAATAQFALLQANDAQARTPDATKDSSDVLEAAINTLPVMTPPDGMDPVRFNKIIADRAERSVLGGNFALYDMLTKSGRINAFDYDGQQTIHRAARNASSEAKVKLPWDFQIKMAEWSTLNTKPGVTDADVVAGAKALDEEYTKITGDSSPLVGGAKTVAELIQLRNIDRQRIQHLANQEAHANAAVDKIKAKEDLIKGVAGLVAGDTGYYMGRDMKTKEQQQEVFDYMRTVATPAGYRAILAKQASFGFIDDVEKDQMQSAAILGINGGDPALFNKAYQERYLPLVQASGGYGATTADQYAGKVKDQLYRYHQLAQGRPVDATQAAVYFAEATQPVGKAVTDSKRDKALLSEVTTGHVMTLIGNTPFQDAAGIVYPKELLSLLKPNISELLPPNQAVERAKREMPTLSIVGGYHWTRNERDTKLTDWFEQNHEKDGVGVDNINRASRYSFDKYAAEAKIDGPAHIGQIANDAMGTPRMFVMGLDSNNQVQIRTFTAKDINKNWVAKNAKPTMAEIMHAPRAQLPL